MRNLAKFTMMIMLVAGLSSCESIKSIFDVEFDTTLSGDLDISVQEQGLKSAAGYTWFDSYNSINPLSDPDIEQYVDEIREIDVDSVIAEVTSIEIDDQMVTDITFKDAYFIISQDGSSIRWDVMGEWPIIVGTKLHMADFGGAYDGIVEILDTMEPFDIEVHGYCDQTNVFITIELSIDIDVVANPL